MALTGRGEVWSVLCYKLKLRAVQFQGWGEQSLAKGSYGRWIGRGKGKTAVSSFSVGLCDMTSTYTCFDLTTSPTPFLSPS